MIVTGAKSMEESMNAAKKYTAIILKIGFPVQFLDYKIQNMTATCDVGFPIRLEGFLYAHAAIATYEPELFPGLVYRMTDPKVVLLIFVSGKVVITGAKTAEDLSAAIEKIYDSLLEFRKKNIVVNGKKG
jgi:transcription initiation factor TFIID TATA-box-binding protein